MGYTIDIDTGGTFTDGFFTYGNKMETVKVPTTPHDLTVCFFKCIEKGAECFDTSIEDLLYETDIIRFSNTIGTNTIIQRDGTKIGLLVNSGMESLAPTSYFEDKPPLVFPDMVLGLDENVSSFGEVNQVPERKFILEAAQELIDRGARCLLVSFKNSEFNPSNERYVRRVIKEEYPRDFLGSVPVFLSSDISQRSGITERLNSAVINAYIHDKLARHLYKAGEDLRKRLYNNKLFIVHNNGAVARVAKTRAINTYHSGPAAGLLGAKIIGNLYGYSDSISLDMGGTSLDLGYVYSDQPSYTLKPNVEGFYSNIPMMAIKAIGAGGGSIAFVKDQMLQVGPQSAGALPGPVCFDLGGAEPTVTDADLILGILSPDFFLGGNMYLNLEKAKEAMSEKVAKPLGLSVEEAALAIKRKIDETMGYEVKKLKKETWSNTKPLLVAYGGAGAAHCSNIASIAGINKIVVTPFSAVFSAFSASNMDVGHLYYQRTDISINEDSDLTMIKDLVDKMKNNCIRDMRGEGFFSQNISFSLELFLQAHKEGSEIKINTDTDFLEDRNKVYEVINDARERLGTTDEKEQNLILNMISLFSQAPVAHFNLSEYSYANKEVEHAIKGKREVFWEINKGPQQTAVYNKDKLQNGHKIKGPAIVESNHTTLTVPEEWKLTVDKFNNVILEEVI